MCGVQGEHRVAFGPYNKSSDNASISRAKAPSKNQVDQGKTSAGATKMATNGGKATQARPGTRQANPTGRSQGKRPKEQPSSHQNRLTNIFLSSRQTWPEEQENFLQGHQYRPANRSLAANTIGTALECASHLAKQKRGTNPTAKPPLALNGATTQNPTSSNFKGCNPSKANKKANELKNKTSYGRK